MREKLEGELVRLKAELQRLQRLALRASFEEPSGRACAVQVNDFKGPFDDWEDEWLG